MDTGTMKDYIEDLIQQSNAAAEVMQKAANEIKALRELVREFYITSQCIECWAEDCGIEGGEDLNDLHNSDLCEVRKVQKQYVAMFRENDYMMAEDDD
jgi:hypothetical protein